MFCIKIAGISIAIENRYPYVEKLCADYLTDDAPLFTVSATDDDIKAEHEMGGRGYPDRIVEATCLHRAIVKQMVNYGIILIHSAVVAVDGEAYVFMAKSGVGKSTHLRQWLAHFGSRAMIVNGDKPMYSFDGDTLMVHGSPWKGKEGWGENISMPVKALCLLERGEQNEIRRATQSEAITKLFHQILVPNDASELAVFMPLINRIISEVPFYRLRCTISEEAAKVAYETMSKGDSHES